MAKDWEHLLFWKGHVRTNSLLIVLFSFPGLTKTTMQFDENVLQYVDGSVSCNDDAPRRPTPGIELMENSFLPLKPNDCTGSKIFDFQRYSSKSCMRWDFEGITTLSTKQGNRNVEAFQSKSLTGLMTESNIDIKANAGVNLGKYSAEVSAEFHTKEKIEDKQSFNRSWEAMRLSQVDNSFVIMDEVMKFPKLDADFKGIIDNDCKGENISQNLHVFSHCLKSLLRTRSHFAETASVGSQTVMVSCFPFSSNFSFSKKILLNTDTFQQLSLKRISKKLRWHVTT